jgi:DNA-binding XRE family transcriptional regulator
LLQISTKIRWIQVSGMPIMNTVKKLREERLMSKAELARLAGVSPITVDRIERGEECRVETKRKILLALGFSLSEKKKVFQD